MSESQKPSELATFKDLFYRLTDAALLLDIESWKIIEFNQATEELFKKTEHELFNHNFLDFFSTEESDKLQQSLRIARRRYHPIENTAHFFIKNITLTLKLTLGVLKLQNSKEVLQVVCQDISAEIEAKNQLQETLKKLEELATTDEMTKLYNYRYFIKRLEEEHNRCIRYNDPYSVIFLDLDTFKHYNDRNGHPAGDELLRQLAKLIKQCTRSVDLVARYGGEEFAVIIPEISIQDTMIVAERIRAAIEKHPFPFAEFQPKGFVSASVGVAGFPNHGFRFEEILKAADDAAYHAKKNGKNQVALYNPEFAIKKSA